MPTVFQRIGNYIYLNKKPLLSKEQRLDLGKIIAQYYTTHTEQFPFKLKRVQQEEPEGKFVVLKYPLVFNDTMDGMIKEYYSANTVLQFKLPTPVIKTEKRLRKRIPLKSKKTS